MNDAPRFRAILRCELVRLLRDRRALFLAVVLPMALYPLYFVGIDALKGEAERRRADETVRLYADLYAAPSDVALAVSAAFEDVENFSWTSRAWPADAEPATAEELEALFERENAPDGTCGWLVAKRVESDDGADDEAAPPIALELWYDGSDENAGELASRVRDALDGASDAWVQRELAARLPSDPQSELALNRVDVASPVDAAGARLGRFFPLVAVLILISGGAYAALDAFAAEREQGTLETLLVQPVPARVVSWAKFSAVALCAGVALLGNLASLVACAASGLVPVDGADGTDLTGAVGPVFAGRILYALLVATPGAMLVSAVLCALSARARTFREAQTLVFPLTIFGALATAPATLPGVELVPTLAAVPMVGTALAMRDALAGHLSFLALVLSVASSSIAAAFALSRVGDLLDLEGLLQHGDTEAEGAQRRRRSRRALSFGWAAVFLIYFVGSWLQSKELVTGLVTTLWGMALGIALLLAWVQSRDGGAPLAGELGLVRPNLRSSLAAVVGAVGMLGLAGVLIDWQSQVLPLPPGLGAEIAALTDLAPWQAFALLALSPAICEELLFRGAITSGLLRDLPARRAVLWQAALFGLAHASIHRFLPTFAVGLALGTLRVRSRSVLPGVVMHALYNGALVAPAILGWDESDAAWLQSPWLLLALPVAALLAAPRARVSPR
ncbi:MAG: CPBP family glutamic-type intramembrane protease [Planctomycetota bacterium]